MEERRKSQRDRSRNHIPVYYIEPVPKLQRFAEVFLENGSKKRRCIRAGADCWEVWGEHGPLQTEAESPGPHRDRGSPVGRRSDKTTKLQVVLDEVVVFFIDRQGPIQLAAGLCGHHARFIAVNPRKIVFHHDTTPLVQNLHPQPLYGAAPLL